METNKTFKVVMEISDIQENNPLDAAKTVEGWIKDHESNFQYYVQDEETGELFSVDLNEEDDEAVLSDVDYSPLIQHNEIERAKQILIKAGYIGVNSMFSSNDVIGRCIDRDLEEPTKEQINLIVSILDRQFNASEGLNWDTIDNAIDEVLEPSID